MSCKYIEIQLTRASNGQPIHIPLHSMGPYYKAGEANENTRIEMVNGTIHAVRETVEDISVRIKLLSTKKQCLYSTEWGIRLVAGHLTFDQKTGVRLSYTLLLYHMHAGWISSKKIQKHRSAWLVGVGS